MHILAHAHSGKENPLAYPFYLGQGMFSKSSVTAPHKRDASATADKPTNS